MASGQSGKAVLASVAGTAAITLTKAAAAAFSGSAGMLAEAIHSFIDTGNSGLLYLGLRRSKRPPDESHPFGYGLELYFWTLIVAVIMVVLGGAATIAEGVRRILEPEPLKHLGWNYAVLGLSAVFNGYTWVVALREFLAGKGDSTLWHALKKAKDPTVLTVLFEDTASLIGLVVAFLSLLLGSWLEQPWLDGLASVLIGVLLGTVALGLVYQSKTLLAGESASKEVQTSLRSLLEQDEAVEQVRKLLTLHLSPEDILLNGAVQLRDGLSTAELAEVLARLEVAIRSKHPEFKRIFLQPAPPATTGQALASGMPGPSVVSSGR